MEQLSMKQIVEVYNQYAETPVKKFAKLSVARQRLQRVLEERGLVMLEDGTVAEPVQDESPRTRGGATVIGKERDAQVIVYVGPNPKRLNSKSFRRFNLYRTEMTVGEYLDACLTHDGDEALPRYRYAADVRWDVERGHIRLEEK